MKNAAKNAEAIRSLLRSFQAEERHAPPPEKQDSLRALVRGAMTWGVSDARVDEVMRHMDREFVNVNELRVATELEIQEMLGSRYPDIQKRVQMITRALNAIFAREHTLSLDRLRGLNRRDARQFLRELPDMNPFVEAYVMLFGFDAPAVPLDEEMLAALREKGLFDASTKVEEAQRFIENVLKDEECLPFYRGLRRMVHGGRRQRRARADN